MFMLSGPVELLFFACLMANEVCYIDFSLLVNQSMLLYLLCVVCLM